jgi:hypothetical protein
LEAVVRVAPTEVALGESLRIEVEVRCTRGLATLNNPFLAEQYELPAQLFIVSKDRTSRYELLHPRNRPDRNSVAPFSIPVRSASAVGRDFLLRVSNDESLESGAPLERKVRLAPGEYSVQIVYSRFLVANAIDWLRNRPQRAISPSPMQNSEAILVSEPAEFKVTLDVSDQRALPAVRDTSLHAELRPAKLSAKTGRRASIEVRFRNDSHDPLQLFNPTLNPGLFVFNRAVNLDFINGEGHFLKDILRTEEGSFRGLLSTDWIRIPPSGTISTTRDFWVGQIPGQRLLFHAEAPPGTYTLELIVYGHVLSEPPIGVKRPSDVTNQRRADRMTIEEWERTFPGPEICRSNRVELEILPRTGD